MKYLNTLTNQFIQWALTKSLLTEAMKMLCLKREPHTSLASVHSIITKYLLNHLNFVQFCQA